jgi:hypothetical protein
MSKQVTSKGNQSKNALKAAEKALKIIASREGVSVEQVRKHIQLAMLSGLVSSDTTIRACWASIPSCGEVPTPEEVIAFCASKAEF